MIVHINNKRIESYIAASGEAQAAITLPDGSTTHYDMYEVATTIQKHRNRDAIDALLTYLASGSTPNARNEEMFAELAYFAHYLS